MNKQEFLIELKKSLKGLRKKEISERVSFYSEMIDDRIEEGLTEEEAVAKISSISEISSTEEVKKEKKSSSKLKTALIIAGSPIWLALIIALFSVLLALVIVAIALAISVVAIVFALFVSLWAILLSLFVGGIAGILSLVIYVIFAEATVGVMYCGAGAVCVGLAILAVMPIKELSKWLLIFIKKAFVFIGDLFKYCKVSFAKKEAKYE